MEKNLDQIFADLKKVLPPDMPDFVQDAMVGIFRFLLAQ